MSCVRPSDDTRRSKGQASSSQVSLYEVDDSIAPIYAYDEKEVVMRYLHMCEQGQAMALISLPLHQSAQLF